MKQPTAFLWMVPLMLASNLLGAPDAPVPFPAELPGYQAQRAAPPKVTLDKALQEKKITEAENDWRLAAENYDRMVQRYGWKSRQAQVAISDLEAAFAIYNKADNDAETY